MTFNIVKTKLYSAFSIIPKPTPFTETFSKTLIIDDKEVVIDFLVIPLDQCSFIWVGVNSAELPSLVVALNGIKGPVATSVLNRQTSPDDEATALRIAKKTNQVVYFSSSIQTIHAEEIRMFAEKTIIDTFLKRN